MFCYTAQVEGGRKRTSSNLSALRNCTVLAMSNLLNANIDSGLMHSIGLGYHRDPQTRAAFMEVLTKILQQGTEVYYLLRDFHTTYYCYKFLAVN